MVAYKRLFWGFIFLFDFRVSHFDMMPDFIGYLFFFYGLKMLEDRNNHFFKAKSFAFPMIFISILDLYQISVPMEDILHNPLVGVGTISSLVTAINLLMVYHICYGIKEEARLVEDTDLESKAENRWKLYLFCNLIILLGMAFPILMVGLFIVFLFFIVVSYLLMLGLMNLASNRFNFNP